MRIQKYNNTVTAWSAQYGTQMQSAVICYGVSTIGNYFFCNCYYLKSIIIPEGVRHLGSYAFWRCDKLEKVFIPSSVETIGDNPFAECASLTAIQLSKDNPNIVLIGSVLFNRDMEKLVLGCRTIEGHFDVPEGVKSIGADAFWDCSKLLSITMPRSLVSVGSRAFKKCVGLRQITSPKGIDYSMAYVKKELITFF